jgi:hypothetical protein
MSAKQRALAGSQEDMYKALQPKQNKSRYMRMSGKEPMMRSHQSKQNR